MERLHALLFCFSEILMAHGTYFLTIWVVHVEGICLTAPWDVVCWLKRVCNSLCVWPSFESIRSTTINIIDSIDLTNISPLHPCEGTEFLSVRLGPQYISCVEASLS